MRVHRPVTHNETPCAGLSDSPHQPASRSLLARAVSCQPPQKLPKTSQTPRTASHSLLEPPIASAPPHSSGAADAKKVAASRGAIRLCVTLHRALLLYRLLFACYLACYYSQTVGSLNDRYYVLHVETYCNTSKQLSTVTVRARTRKCAETVLRMRGLAVGTPHTVEIERERERERRGREESERVERERGRVERVRGRE